MLYLHWRVQFRNSWWRHTGWSLGVSQMQFLCPLTKSGLVTSWILVCSPTRKWHWVSVSMVSTGVLLHRHDLFSHWLHNWTQSPTSHPSLGMGLSYSPKPRITWLVPLVTNPNHVIPRGSWIAKTVLLGNPKDLEPSLPRDQGQKPNYYTTSYKTREKCAQMHLTKEVLISSFRSI